jgi:potassium intermediate/small conductance calcium-activated channel subfamily N protein 2
MIVEMIIYCVIPFPFTIGMRIDFYNNIQAADAYYHLNEILALFMITRTVFLFRTILA